MRKSERARTIQPEGVKSEEVSYKYLEQRGIVGRTRPFSVVPSHSKKGNDHTLRLERFSVRLIEHWQRVAQGNCDIFILGDSQKAIRTWSLITDSRWP